MLSRRYSNTIRLSVLFLLVYLISSCGQGEGPTPIKALLCQANGEVRFGEESYSASDASAEVIVKDECVGRKETTVKVTNGTDTIMIDLNVIDGEGTAIIKFGVTNDVSGSIAVQEGDVITATYEDANEVSREGKADITAPALQLSTLGIYSETNNNPLLPYSEISNNDVVVNRFGQSVIPLEGVSSLQADFSIPPSGNENSYEFTFFGLTNATFEAVDASGGNVEGADGWTTFEFAFTNNTAGPGFGPVSHDVGGTQSLTMFGPFSFDSATGAYQPDNEVIPGESYTAVAHVMNWAGDPLASGNLGIFQLTFWDAPGGQDGGGNQLGPAQELIVDSIDDATNIYIPVEDGADISDWTRLEITQTAPAGAASAEIFLLHIQLNSDPLTQAGSIFWDDVSLNGVKALAGRDISTYETLKFGINTASASGLMDLEVRLGDSAGGSASVFISNYTSKSTAVAGWVMYEIPLNDFSGIDKTRMTSLGFHNASSTVTGTTAAIPTLFAATLHFDDIHFAKADTGPAPLTGVLINSPIEGVSYSTPTQSGITNVDGEFQYLPGEMVTFSIGDIILGTVEGASFITPVELTGSGDPVDQTATNMLVFLQSIDSDMDYTNGITVSSASQAAAIGQTLDFTLDSGAFTAAVTPVVIAATNGNPAGPNTVVSETSALDNFYVTYTNLDGSNTFSWTFPPQYPPYPGVANFPVDFEAAGAPYYLTNFEGGVATVIDNPQKNGSNTSDRVVQMQKFSGAVYGGSTLTLGDIDFSVGKIFTMKVWASRAVPVTLKLEGLSNVELVANHTGSGAWEELVFDFSGMTGDGVREVTLIFDNGIEGDAANDAPNWTFYVDDINLQSTNPGTFALIWSDEFDVNGAPSAANWVMETGYGVNGWGNNEWQLYTDSPDNVKVEGGNLVITADCPTAPTCGVRDGTVTSARVNTLNRFSFKYGKVEARIKPPVGNGAWPAFWMLGKNFPVVGWPFSGEVDIMEVHNAFSDEFTTHFTMHWCDDSKQNPSTPEVCFPQNEGWTFFNQNLTLAESLGNDYHLFSAEWDSNGITGFIDGTQYFYKAIDPANMDEFLKEFFMIFNVAMGGTLGSNNAPPDGSETWPQIMLVDYVRVYQRIGGDGTYTIGGGAPLEPLGVYSETNTDPVLNYSEIINVADFGGKNTLTDENSTDTVLEGSVSLKADYISTGPGLNYNGYVFNFGPAAVSGNQLVNASFEVPDASAGDIGGCGGGAFGDWNYFNCNFVSSNSFMPGGSFVNPGAHDGSQLLKQFGGDAGVFQTIAASPGETINASAYALNWDGDNFNNIGLLQIFFYDASGDNITDPDPNGFVPAAQVSAGSDAIVGGSFDYVLSGQDGGELTDWTLMEVSAVAPAGTVEVKVQMIHILEGSTSPSGALWWDDARITKGVAGPAQVTDISNYEVIKFGLNTSAASGLMDLEVKMEDDSAGSASVFLSDYTATPGSVTGWDLYEIPLSDFSGVDLTNIMMLGYWNASSTVTGSTSIAPTLLDASLYFDDIHFDAATVGGVNQLVNASFEVPDASAGDIGGCGGGAFGDWNYFNCNFVSSNSFMPGGSFVNPGAHDGSQLLKQFGGDAGVFQTIAASPGETINASAYALNWDGDNFNNIGLLQIFFYDASGDNITDPDPNGFVPAAQVSAGSDAIVGGSFDYVLSGQDGGELTDWTLMEVSAVAPAGTVEVKVQMIHILEGSTSPSGALWWDDAKLSITAP